MDDDDYLSEDDSVREDGPARDGYFWVNPHNHVVIAPGSDPKPTGHAVVKMRRYFSDLDRGIEAFATEFTSKSWKNDVRRACAETAEAMGEPFRECFFVVDEQKRRSRDYLAVVFGHRRAGSMWAKKNVLHSTQRVSNSVPGKGKISHLFQVELPGFNEKGASSGSVSDAPRKTCPFDPGYQLSLAGDCYREEPGCSVCGAG